MARIGIMTFLHNDNYGSTLQAWALLQALQTLGHQAEDIDYHPSRKEKILNLLKSGNSPLLILDGIRKRRASGSRPAGFDAFRREALVCSPRCADHAALKRQAADYDLVMCGSDQVWSPVWLNPAYFLDFTDKPKAAYACSLGVKEMPVGRKQRKMKALVKPFSAVSVREEEGAALLERITGRRPDVMPDPVMLVEKDRWQALAKAPENTDPYLLCYFIGDNPAYWAQVRAVSEQLRLPVKVISMTQGALASGYEVIPCDPGQWLGMIDHAAHLITDSFHGAAFACVLNRPFTVLRRYREDDPESKNSRIDQLLRTVGLPEKNEAPDWAAVNARLSEVREKGIHWLDDAIQAALGEHPAAQR